MLRLLVNPFLPRLTAFLHSARELAKLNPLAAYVLTAILARTCTGGAAVAVILLAREAGAEGSLIGAFTACLTAPHMLGPLYGRWLEQARNPFFVIAAACFIFATFFQVVVTGVALWNPWILFPSLLVCGACGCFLMSGLSTQLHFIAAGKPSARRRAQSWDAMSYGLGLTLGPMLIAIFSSQYSIASTVSVLMCLPVAAGILALILPKPNKQQSENSREIPSLKRVMISLWQTPALKTTLFMTSGAALSVAALPVLAVYLSEAFAHPKEKGAYLVTLYGIGCLCGASALILKPLAKAPLILLRNIGALLALCLALVALGAHLSFAIVLLAYWLCGVVNALFFASTIAARTEYAPKQGAAQIYMWVAASKITAASFGALLAGLLVEYYLYLPIYASIIALTTLLALCFWRLKK